MSIYIKEWISLQSSDTILVNFINDYSIVAFSSYLKSLLFNLCYLFIILEMIVFQGHAFCGQCNLFYYTCPGSQSNLRQEIVVWHKFLY